MAAEAFTAARFSQTEKDVIERKLGVISAKTKTREELEMFYEIDNCVKAIKQNGFTKIALQFPDSLLADSAAVASIIEQETNREVFILADTSYGSCCVDEVAAEHVNADLVIHYGQACLSRVRRLPVIYVFGKKDMNIPDCCKGFGETFPDTNSRVIVMFDVTYSHCIDEVQKAIGSLYPNAVFSKLNYPTLESFTSTRKGEESVDKDEQESGDIQFKFGRQFQLHKDTAIEDYSVFYIGSESLTLTNLMMTYNRCQFFTFNPSSSSVRKETLNVNRALMKRYYMIQKAKDAQVVGIVVGTLGVADYLKVIERLKKILQMAGKKSYLFVMGKLNVAKMANFMEVDIFVLVACPENTLINSEDFYRPVVTPFEMEVACLRSQEWTGEYITDFHELLPGGSHAVELDEEENSHSTDGPEISLVTGNLRPNYKTKTDPVSLSVVERNQETAIATQHHTSGAEFLTSRSWQGLQPKLGETQVTKAVEGRKGIAAGYTHEMNAKVEDKEETLKKDSGVEHN